MTVPMNSTKHWSRAMKATDLVCRKCNDNMFDASLRGAYLGRVNEKGVPGIFECKPSCEPNPIAGSDDALLSAIKGDQDDEN